MPWARLAVIPGGPSAHRDHDLWLPPNRHSFSCMGQQMVSVTGLVADPHRHDHLMLSIVRHLAVVALNPAVSALCRASALAASTSWARASPGMKHMY